MDWKSSYAYWQTQTHMWTRNTVHWERRHRPDTETGQPLSLALQTRNDAYFFFFFENAQVTFDAGRWEAKIMEKQSETGHWSWKSSTLRTLRTRYAIWPSIGSDRKRKREQPLIGRFTLGPPVKLQKHEDRAFSKPDQKITRCQPDGVNRISTPPVICSVY